MKKDVYCVFCGTKNDTKNKLCSKCHKSLTPKDHLWRDYFKNHIKDELRGKVEDKMSSIITNYITSHLYGIAFSILLVTTLANGITSIIKENHTPIKEIEEYPTIVTELSLDDEQVKKAQSFLKQDYLKKFPTGFYEGKKMTYDDLKEKYGMTFDYIFDYKDLQNISITFNSCNEAKIYPDIYNLCQFDSSYVVGEVARNYYLFDTKYFEKKYKELYGNDKVVEKENFKVFSIYECTYYKDLDKYICHTLETGWNTDSAEFTKLVKAEKVNNQMILYDYYVYGTPDGTYKDSQATIKISDKEIWDNEYLVEQGQLYKHIFKKNGNNGYYWYSSEPVNSLED